ncbi:multidrug effflux MFS transporter [Naasia aerilata]|uniref:Bcr/CflA family drug resistance efflux transporter n=1 Tax=Naasia aerilata TaxID=1162966 RepID=A0ABM8GD36_9MICO|nr:multidrug effflux MFS transporter [Naasia aerilata]BDZ46179.1 Bcr/CflA family drug resistance efflux transporter [Naasia aerilata]
MTSKDDGKVSPVVIAVLGVLSGVGPFSLDAYLPAFPAIAADFGVTASAVQLTLTACLVGLALGQLVIGPWADRVGRRLPLLLGTLGYLVTSLACAASSSIEVFTLLRFTQGFCGAAGLVIARAVVRDVASGRIAVRIYSQLAFVSGIAPIVAPLLGAAALTMVSWRGVFVGLAVLGALLAGSTWLLLKETHPIESRVTGPFRSSFLVFGVLLRIRAFAGYVLVGGLAAAILFGYISGSSFVVQEIYGGTPGEFALIFAINGIGLALAGQVNARIAPRVGAPFMLRVGLLVQVVATAGLALFVFLGGRGSLWAVAVLLFLAIAPLGMVMPNAVAVSMGQARGHAGTASALLGVTTFLFGAAVTPLSGLGQPAVAMVLTMLGAVAGALVVVFILRRKVTLEDG